MGDPISLYRFLDPEAAVKTVEAGRFRVGQLSKFNDPFEWVLGSKGVVTIDEKLWQRKSKEPTGRGWSRGWGC